MAPIPVPGIVTRTRAKTKKPSLYKVLLLNDDYTPMEFVVHILEKFFAKSREDAVEVMLHVHRHGVGICGVFTFEVAETKVAQVALNFHAGINILLTVHHGERVMPSLSRSLEQALHHAIKLASDRHHEYATLEHLLLALMDDADAAQVMKACNVDTPNPCAGRCRNMWMRNWSRW